MIFTPQATRLVRRLLAAHTIYLEREILYNTNEDAVADASNELGYVLAIIRTIDNDIK